MPIADNLMTANVVQFYNSYLDGELPRLSNGGKISFAELSEAARVSFSEISDFILDDYISLLKFVLSRRKDLDYRRSGKNSGIGIRSTGQKLSPSEFANKYANKHYALFMEKAPAMIEQMLQDAEEKAVAGERVHLKMETLCPTIAKELELKAFNIYYCLRKYIAEDAPELAIYSGARGGLGRKCDIAPAKKTLTTQSEVSNIETDTETETDDVSLQEEETEDDQTF